MSLHVIKPGLQTTVQASQRRGYRYLGVPASGAADPLSLALANRLVGNPLLAAGLEISLNGMTLGAESAIAVAVTGAIADVHVNGSEAGMHRMLHLRAGDELKVGGARAGARAYLAIAGGIDLPDVLGSKSTYLPASLGGLHGRALKAGDRIDSRPASVPEDCETPADYRPSFGAPLALRACPGVHSNADELFDEPLVVGNRADRMGLLLEGVELRQPSDGRLPSVPVFPGCVQCTDSGAPFLLSVDAQTTGGYAQVAQVARVDRHSIGQLKAHDHVRLIRRDPAAAVRELREKVEYWGAWLPHPETIFV